MINKRLKDALFSDQWSELCMDTLSPSGYVLVSRATHVLYFNPTFTTIHRCATSVASFSLRWRPSVCKGCCCWCSLNSATFLSSEVCRHRVRGRGSAGVGYVDSSTSQIVHAAKIHAGGGWGVERWGVPSYIYMYIPRGSASGCMWRRV